MTNNSISKNLSPFIVEILPDRIDLFDPLTGRRTEFNPSNPKQRKRHPWLSKLWEVSQNGGNTREASSCSKSNQ